MKRLVVPIVAAFAATLFIAGCTQAAPAPTPTRAAEPTKAPAAPAAPTKVAEPTKAPTVAPTAAPAKVDYPGKGKNVTMIIPWPPAGNVDLTFRVLASAMEEPLGTKIQILNKEGAGSQVGLTELALSKPDGYTIGNVQLPTAITIYLDPGRKAVFGRKDLQLIAMHTSSPTMFAVKADAPFNSLKDLIDAAKANPKKIRAADTGLLGVNHLAVLQLERLSGASFASVHMDGSAPATTALLGGKVEVYVDGAGANVTAQVKAGAIKVLGVADDRETKFLPGIKTFESQGYKLYSASRRTLGAPAGVPKEIMDILSDAARRAMATPAHQAKMDELAVEPRYMGPAELATYWTNLEAEIEPLMKLAAQQ